MEQYIALKVGIWLMLVFMMAGLFGWDLIDDMERLQLEAKVIENSTKQNHDLHALELGLHGSLDPVKEFLITGDYRLEDYFSHLYVRLIVAVRTYNETYPDYALNDLPKALKRIEVLSGNIFKLPYAVGNMEGPLILQELTEVSYLSVQQLSKQHHILDGNINDAMHMMAGLRMDMHDEALLLLFVLLLSLGYFTYFIYSQIVLPLTRMRTVVQQVGQGNFSVQCDVTSKDEIGSLAVAFNMMEQELQERDEKLNHTRSLAAYRDKMSALGIMAGGIAHEVGNSLSALSVSLQVAQKKLFIHDKSAAQTQVQIALKETVRMESIIQIILNFGRHEAMPMMRIFSIPPVIASAIQLAQMMPRKKSIHMNVNAPEILPQIYAEEGMLLQILLNLILNALDACDDHGHIDISVFEDSNEKIIIQIKDDGHGIADEIKSDIFKPEFTSKPRGKGTGLGLAISRELIHSMDGSLELICSDGSGSCFQICLPTKEVV